MEPKEPFDFSQARIYDLFDLDAHYPDRIVSFADRYVHWHRIYSIIKYFRREIKKRGGRDFNVLDIGCGRGYIDFKLKGSVSKDYNLQVIGIDSYKPAIDFANTRKKYLHRDDCDFELMDASNLRFENDSFDIVMCLELLEHIKEPQIVIKEMYRVLKKGGFAIISTPNMRKGALSNFFRVMLKALFNYKKYKTSESSYVFKQEQFHQHVSVKNHKEWTKDFKRNGFSLQKKIGAGGMLYNYKFWEAHRILFGLMVILDTLLENLPFSYLWSETALFVLKKDR